MGKKRKEVSFDDDGPGNAKRQKQQQQQPVSILIKIAPPSPQAPCMISHLLAMSIFFAKMPVRDLCSKRKRRTIEATIAWTRGRIGCVLLVVSSSGCRCSVFLAQSKSL